MGVNPVVNALQRRILAQPETQLSVLGAEIVVDILVCNGGELLLQNESS